jgi:hypothetical protein
MINVIVGEQKTQGTKPFPKLMSANGWIGYFTRYGVCLCLLGDYAGEYLYGVEMEGMVDYNEELTLKNA